MLRLMFAAVCLAVAVSSAGAQVPVKIAIALPDARYPDDQAIFSCIRQQLNQRRDIVVSDTREWVPFADIQIRFATTPVYEGNRRVTSALAFYSVQPINDHTLTWIFEHRRSDRSFYEQTLLNYALPTHLWVGSDADPVRLCMLAIVEINRVSMELFRLSLLFR